MQCLSCMYKIYLKLIKESHKKEDNGFISIKDLTCNIEEFFVEGKIPDINETIELVVVKKELEENKTSLVIKLQSKI